MKKLVGIASQKDVVPISVTGSTLSGSYNVHMSVPIILNPDATHRIYLKSFSCWQNIPNIKTGINDNFTYRNAAGTTRTITIPQGTYELKDINEYIEDQQELFGDTTGTSPNFTYPVSFDLNHPTQQFTMHINITGTMVDFTPFNSVAKLIGFNPGTYTTAINYSQKNVDILPNQVINISCSICRGAIINGTVSNILHAFPNSVKPGHMIIETPNPVVPCIVNSKTISDIAFSFFDEDRNPLNFNGEEFSIYCVIEQL